MARSANKHDQPPVKADINVTPMVDVMLVLLIIFMIVTPVITAGFQATLPTGVNPDPKPEEEGDIILGIDRNGQFFIDYGDGPFAIQDDALPDRLTGIYATRTRDKILFLKAHEGIEFSRVQEGIEIARKAGVRVVAAIAEQSQQLFQEGGR